MKVSIPLYILFLLLFSPLCYSQSMNGFDLVGSLIPIDEIKQGGPPRDGIPSIDHPEFVSRERAKQELPPDTRAIIVEHAKMIKAYPIPILNWHEIVNDQIGKLPIVVTYCPLCGTGVVFERSYQKRKLSFGVSGLLYNSDVLLYDRNTESLWSQIMRKGITGKMKGRELTIVPSKIVPLFEFLKQHPKTQVLSTNTGYSRDYKRSPYGNYSSSGSLYFPVSNLDQTVHIKTWSLLIETDDKRVILPISSLNAMKGKREFVVGTQRVGVNFDKNTQTLYCSPTQKTVTCMTGYYFALKAFYPEAEVILNR